MEVVNIVNASLPNQRLTGGLIEQGFKALGYSVRTTTDRQAHGDITVVHGPNYAKDIAHGRVIWLDRCWYGDTNEWVSLGWKVDNRNRRYAAGSPERLHHHIEQGFVRLRPMKAHGSTIILDDWQQTHISYAHQPNYRAHPARKRYDDTLIEAMEPHSHAICGSGTCAAQAWLEGLDVYCSDPYNIVHTDRGREAWAERLAWTQFTNAEIASGFAIDKLLSHADIPVQM